MNDECVHFNFEWLYITLGVSISTSVLVTIIWTSYFRLMERFVRVRRRRQAIADIINKTLRYTYLGYISVDDDVVRDDLEILKEFLKQSLIDIIGGGDIKLCLGQHEFRPGHCNLNEQERCLRDSAIVLVLLSHDYCQNNICNKELNMAYELEKPICFIMMGDFSESV